jgi:hypothetical protein
LNPWVLFDNYDLFHFVTLLSIIWFSTSYAVEIFGEAWKIPQRKQQAAFDKKLQQ